MHDLERQLLKCIIAQVLVIQNFILDVDVQADVLREVARDIKKEIIRRKNV